MSKNQKFAYAPESSETFIRHWEKFNQDSLDPNAQSVIYSRKGKVLEREHSESYSHYFTDNYFNQYLKNAPKRILELGSGNGKFLQKYYRDGYQVMGYDYSETATTHSNQNNTPAKRIDLNSIDKDSGMLSYADELNKDLCEPCNIFAIRVLEYLTAEAAKLLIFSLMDTAKSGSVFFLAVQVEPKEKAKKDFSLEASIYPRFFAARTDMQLLLNKTAATGKNRELKDEILAVQKL